MPLSAPKKPRWLAATAAIAGLSLLAAVLLARRAPWHPGRNAGLVFGILAGAIFTLEVLYPLRRRLLAWPLGNTQRWIQFHIYGGALAFFFVLIHEGPHLPEGSIGWLLLSLTIWTTLSGLVGVWLQKWIPAALSKGLELEVIYERIPEILRALQQEADGIRSGASEMLSDFYRDAVVPSLSGIHPSWSYLWDVRSGRDARLAPFARLSAFLDTAERDRLSDLRSILVEKMELDAHYSLQRILRAWLVLHLPPALLLFGLVLFHVWTSVAYL